MLEMRMLKIRSSTNDALIANPLLLLKDIIRLIVLKKPTTIYFKAEMKNRQVILRDHVKALPKESNLMIVTNTVELSIKPGSALIQPISGEGVSKVIDSDHPAFKFKTDSEYQSMPGLTAYVGFYEICEPKK